MAELADAADSKSAEVYPSWGFDPPSRHQPNSLMLRSLGGEARGGERGRRGPLGSVTNIVTNRGLCDLIESLFRFPVARFASIATRQC